jgi:hypothetical protein
MTNWNPNIDLVRLLEALGQEVTATTDEEVRQACTAYRSSVGVVAGEVRRLLATVIDDPANPSDDPSEPGTELSPAQFARSLEQRQRH